MSCFVLNLAYVHFYASRGNQTACVTNNSCHAGLLHVHGDCGWSRDEMWGVLAGSCSGSTPLTPRRPGALEECQPWTCHPPAATLAWERRLAQPPQPLVSPCMLCGQQAGNCHCVKGKALAIARCSTLEGTCAMQDGALPERASIRCSCDQAGSWSTWRWRCLAALSGATRQQTSR